MAELGALPSTVSITTLHGTSIVPHPLPREWAEVTWTRSLSEVSSATAKLTTSRAAAETLRDTIEPWTHILSIHRDGVLAWSGPVLIPTTQGAAITLECRDPSILLSRRVVLYEMSWTNHDVSDIAAGVIRAAVGGDDPYGLAASMTVAPMGASRYTSYYIAPRTKLVSEVLSDLVDHGLEWTCSAGRLFIGPVQRDRTTAPVTEAHLSTPLAISKDGSDQVTAQTVLGRGVSASFTDTAAPIRLDGIESVDSITNSGACFDEARRRVKSRVTAPYRIVPGSSRLLPTAPVTLDELIPGVGVPLAVARAAESIDTVMRLTGVSVDAATDAVDLTLATMPAELEPQEFASPAVGDTKSDADIGETPTASA